MRTHTHTHTLNTPNILFLMNFPAISGARFPDYFRCCDCSVSPCPLGPSLPAGSIVWRTLRGPETVASLDWFKENMQENMTVSTVRLYFGISGKVLAQILGSTDQLIRLNGLFFARGERMRKGWYCKGDLPWSSFLKVKIKHGQRCQSFRG